MDVHALWSAIDVPTLLVRAVVPLPDGLIVPDSEAEALCAAVPQVRVVEIDRNHWGVVTDPGAAKAIAHSSRPEPAATPRAGPRSRTPPR
jgi:hypothetical protein